MPAKIRRNISLANNDHKRYLVNLRLLFDKTVVDEDGQTALMHVCNNNLLDIARYFLGFGANVNCVDLKGWTSLTHSCSQGHVNIVRLLLSHKADVNCLDLKDWSALTHACSKGHVNTVRLLLDNGVDVRELDLETWEAQPQGSCNEKIDFIIRRMDDSEATSTPTISSLLREKIATV